MKKKIVLLVIVTIIYVTIFPSNYVLLINNCITSTASVSNVTPVLSIRKTLTEYKFVNQRNIINFINPQKNELITVLSELKQKITPLDSILVYYYGYNIINNNKIYYASTDNASSVSFDNIICEDDFKLLFSSIANEILIIFDIVDRNSEKLSPPIFEFEKKDYIIYKNYNNTTKTKIPYFIETLFSTSKYMPRVSEFADYLNELTTELFGLNIKNESLYKPIIINPIKDKKYGLSTNFEWITHSKENDKFLYDIYFGETSIPPIYISNQKSSNFQLPGYSLKYSTNYYLKIVSKDTKGNSYESEIVPFKTTDNIIFPKLIIGTFASLGGCYLISFNPTSSLISSLTFSSALITFLGQMNNENSNFFVTFAGGSVGLIVGAAVSVLFHKSDYSFLNLENLKTTFMFIIIGSVVGETLISSF